MIYKYVVWYMRTKLQCDGVKILDTWKFLAITLPVHFTMNCFLTPKEETSDDRLACELLYWRITGK